MDENPTDDVSKKVEALTEALRKELQKQQDPVYAAVGGLAAALVSAVIWAMITVATEYQIAYMAVGVGLLVGFSVRLFGAGVDQYFGIIGAAFSLLGCLLGNLLSQVGFIATAQGMTYFETITLLNLDVIVDIYKESFSPIDLVFYGVAAYGGYRISFRNLGEELTQAVAAGSVQPPAFARFRLPVVIVLFVGLSVLGLVISRGSDEIRTFNYESGGRRAAGALALGRETGPWQSWWENGNLQAEGNYVDGQPDSTWTYYDEDGKLSKHLTFRLGVEHGPVTEYYADGGIASQGQYKDGRQDGEWTFLDPQGVVMSKGNFAVDQPDGQWEYYYANGQLRSQGKFDAGKQLGLWVAWTEAGAKIEEIEYTEEGVSRILNTWDDRGRPVITNGVGPYKSYYDGGQLMEVGVIRDGVRTGSWKTYYESGSPQKEGEYNKGVLKLIHAWDENGQQTVKSGEGTYSGYAEGSGMLETGAITAGMRTGLWKTFFPDTETVMVEVQYVDGKVEGVQKSYHENGQLSAEGKVSNDLRVGDWTWYSQDGIVESTATFVNGKKDGVQYFFDSDGELLRTETYSNGKLVESSGGS
jgi:antitoxin component YwqK of YwqJK toxin-antitoxin module